MIRVVHVAASIKRLFILVASIALIVIIYRILLPNELRSFSTLVSIVGIWAFSAYIVLPRLHRFLSILYVPDYFIARTRTADGLLGDPVNLALLGSTRSLKKAMKKAGWVEAEPITIKSTWRMIINTIRGREYPEAPVSSLFLFDRKQDIAFQKQVAGNPRKRHHVRFWKTEKDWYLPGGYRVDWVAASTYDSAVGLSMFTLQFTHRIDPNIDQERDFLVKTLNEVDAVKHTENITHFAPPFKTRNGGGDRIVTDGSMVILTLKNYTKF